MISEPAAQECGDSRTTEWKIGDKVRLVSGGPEMTVIGFSPRGNVWCEWEVEPGEWEPPQWEEESFVHESLIQSTDANDSGAK